MRDSDRWEPEPGSTLSEAIRQAVGTASMCWENVAGAGAFDSDKAYWVASGLERWMHEQHHIGLR